MGNTFVGPGSLVTGDPFYQSSTRENVLGQQARTADGRTFRYARNGGTALTAGQLCVAATVVANHVNLTPSAASVGDTTLTVTLGATAASENDYADGYAVAHVNPGAGRAYAIGGHPAASASASLAVNLKEPIVEATTTTTRWSLHRNPYDDVVISVTDQLDMAVGVPVDDVSVDNYFWIQTGGPCSVLADETIAIGQALAIGTGTAGAVEAADLIGEQNLGIAIQAGVDTEFRLCFLQMNP